MNTYQLNTEDLYNATDGGLDILYKYVDTCKKNKLFKYRNERTASAKLYNNGKYWVVKDFGNEMLSPINVVMDLKGMDFYTALKHLYNEFNVNIEKKPTFDNIEFKENIANHSADYFKIKVKKKYENLKYFGRFVTSEIAKNYNVFEVEYYERITKNNKLLITKSTENYPIFIYTNDVKKWAKIYQPGEFKRTDANGKTINYKHGYLGNKPASYLHGLEHILKTVDFDYLIRLNSELYSENVSKTRAEELIEEINTLKLDTIIICSGGSDGLNVASMSEKVYPVWLNSEGEFINYEQYQILKLCCKNLYNLPDIDKSGIKYAHTLANKYWNLKTIWLPVDKMRGGKDFRDWLNYYKNADYETIKRKFKQLSNYAVKCNFIELNDNNRHVINVSNYEYFLNVNNFYTYKENLTVTKDNENTAFLIKIEDNVVTIPDSSDVLNFTVEYLKDKGVTLDIINVFKKSVRYLPNNLKKIKTIDIDFTNNGRDFQLFYFKNGLVTVTANGVEFKGYGSLNNNNAERYVWKHKIVDKTFIETNKYFEYYKDDTGNNRVKILDYSCEYLNFLINGSRVYWQEELKNIDTLKELEIYREKNLFTLNAECLTEEQQIIQEQHFLNKCYVLGYLLHRYKVEGNARFVYVLDDALKDFETDANGGTGKSVFLRALKEILKVFVIDAKENFTKNSHLLGGVTLEHDLILVEDGEKNQTIDYFYNKITGDLVINPKTIQGVTIPYSLSPKFAGTFNYGLPKEDPSDIRRIFYTSFGDYYHAKADKFNKSRVISEDFNHQLFTDWSCKDYDKNSQYNKFFNFLCECLSFYLSNLTNEMSAPMGNIKKNNLKAQMGGNFVEWAENYFIGEENFNINLIKEDLYKNYRTAVGDKSALGISKFKKALEKYCIFNGYIFNPKRFLNSRGIIVVNMYEGVKRISKECIYIENLNLFEKEDNDVDRMEF